MLRALLIYLSKASWAQSIVTRWGFAWRTASRFVSGTDLNDALNVVAQLNNQGINATLDHLGEHTTTEQEAQQATEAILRILDALAGARSCSNVSIKLTQIGLGLDADFCEQNLERILLRARERSNFVRIDIEDSPYTDRTFELFRRMRNRGFENVGAAIQSCLFRSENDAKALLQDRAPIRLVKGAYQEPPDKAYARKVDVDASYDRIAAILLDASAAAGSRLSSDCRVPPIPAMATHDEKRIAYCRAYAERIGLPKNGLEFQMLYGIRRDLQVQLARLGYPVRVYVPFGTHWYPYLVRRLAERPANIWFFVSNFFRK